MGAFGVSCQNDVSTLEIPMNHAIPVCLGQACANLQSDRAGLGFRHLRPAEAGEKRLAIQKLHGKKIGLVLQSRRSVNFKNPTGNGFICSVRRW